LTRSRATKATLRPKIQQQNSGLDERRRETSEEAGAGKLLVSGRGVQNVLVHRKEPSIFNAERLEKDHPSIMRSSPSRRRVSFTACLYAITYAFAVMLLQ